MDTRTQTHTELLIRTRVINSKNIINDFKSFCKTLKPLTIYFLSTTIKKLFKELHTMTIHCTHSFHVRKLQNSTMHHFSNIFRQIYVIYLNWSSA